jgi:site-specific DNA-methyltransferase (adenine-specific)
LSGKVYLKDALEFLEDYNIKLKEEVVNSVDFVYIDPPFGTNKDQSRGTYKYSDTMDFDELLAYLVKCFKGIHNILASDGSLFVHLDYRMVHYAKVELDKIFGRDNFKNEIIWAYDYGAKQKNRWPAKHDNILWYTKDVGKYTFHASLVPRIPYASKAWANTGRPRDMRGKLENDWWILTIVPTNSKEKTGYPTQKPISILKRLIEVHTNEGDLVLDCFGGAGTTAFVADSYQRDFILVDNNPQAIDVTRRRLEHSDCIFFDDDQK